MLVTKVSEERRGLAGMACVHWTLGDYLPVHGHSGSVESCIRHDAQVPGKLIDGHVHTLSTVLELLGYVPAWVAECPSQVLHMQVRLGLMMPFCHLFPGRQKPRQVVQHRKGVDNVLSCLAHGRELLLNGMGLFELRFVSRLQAKAVYQRILVRISTWVSPNGSLPDETYDSRESCALKLPVGVHTLTSAAPRTDDIKEQLLRLDVLKLSIRCGRRCAQHWSFHSLVH